MNDSRRCLSSRAASNPARTKRRACPRGKARGIARGTHDASDRDDVNERTVRPLDAEGALAYLRSRKDVVASRIVLQGWSNGGSTALNVMIRRGTKDGFRAMLGFHPGCGPKSLVADNISTNAREGAGGCGGGGEQKSLKPKRCNFLAALNCHMHHVMIHLCGFVYHFTIRKRCD